MNKKVFAIVLAVFSLGLVIGGGYATTQGRQATNDVRDRIVAQNIITSEDADIPNVLVDSADTAIAQADVIGVHADESVKEMLGESLQYAEIPHTNPDGSPLDPASPEFQARSLLQSAAGLRSALYGTAAAFELARLVTYLGLFFVVSGLFGLYGALVLRRS